ncbi:hypothetical protein CLIB1423_29S01046 [[Candida] railenensis]|uniref:Ubiquitin carboxyl-terminal hydrolase n=1 Tax=[Candida] railenensis TaxID=45579 RepID=A0A9P0QVH9_9ASCO|nr:hypothetical protein CLIB1423_29S01046 [[Candida] railenensis]
MSYEIYGEDGAIHKHDSPSQQIPIVSSSKKPRSTKLHSTNNRSKNGSSDHAPIEKFPIESSPIHRNAMKVITREFRALQLDRTINKSNVFDLLEVCQQLYESSQHTKVAATMVQNYIRGYLIFAYFINNSIMAKFGGFQNFMKKSEYDFLIYINLFNFFDSDPNLELKQLRSYIEELLENGNYLEFDMKILVDWLHSYLNYLREKDAYEAEKDNESDNIYDMSELKRELDNEEIEERSTDHLAEDYDEEEDEIENLRDDRSAYTYEGDQMSLSSFKEKFPVVKGSATGSSVNSVKVPSKNLTPSNGVNGNTQTNLSRVPPPLDNIVDLETNKKTSSPTYVDRVPPSSNPYYSQNYQESPSSRPTIYNQSLSYSASSTPHRPTSSIPSLPQSFTPSNSTSFNHAVTQTNGSNNHNLQQTNGNYNQNNIYHGAAYNQPPIPHPQTMPNLMTRPSIPVPDPQQQYNPQYQQNYYPQQLSHAQPQNLYQQSQQPVVYHNPHTYNKADQAKQEKLAYMKANAICGLKNFGSSCYINSSLQLLFALIQFKSIFINSRYHKYIRDPKYVEQFNLNSTEPILLSVAISGLLKSFINHGSCGIAPSKFLRICAKLKPDFNIPNEQQDAQEFLMFLLERLHDELSVKNLNEESANSVIYKSEVNVNTKDKDDYFKWYRALIDREGVSPVNDLFQGHLQNKLICNACGYESVTYSPFNTLSLTIPQPGIGGGGNRDGSVDLSDCLKYFIKDEILTGDNAWNCPKCADKSSSSSSIPSAANSLDNHPVFQPKKGIFSRKKSPVRKSNEKDSNSAMKSALKNTISIKRLSFVKLPQILLIHLSRFSMYNLSDKLNTAIKYPLQLKFNDPTSTEGGKIHYKLTGLINHYGNLKSGHYTSLVNKSTYHQQQSTDSNAIPNNIDNLIRPYWCCFDDDLVDSSVKHGNVNPEQGAIIGDLNSTDVYVLCYEKVHPKQTKN